MPYLNRTEFIDQSLPTAVLDGLSEETIDAALIYASRQADGYLAKAHTLPLVSWDEDLKALVGDLAQYRLLSRRGFRPGSGNDVTSRQRYDDAIATLRLISKGEVVLANVEDSTVTEDEDGPLIAESDSTVKTFTFNTGRRGSTCCD
jgi:phage gp36-like protein